MRISMAQVLLHTIAHFTGPSFMLKANNQIFRSCIQLSKRCQKLQNFDFQSKFSMSKIIRIFPNFFFIEQYQFRSTFFVVDIF